MSVFDHPEFDQHESLHFVQDPKSGLKAIIAIHSTALGPAAGGCRRWQYASDDDALTDVASRSYWPPITRPSPRSFSTLLDDKSKPWADATLRRKMSVAVLRTCGS
jgi:hypothetical protein